MRGFIQFVFFSAMAGLFAGCEGDSTVQPESQIAVNDSGATSHGHSHEGDDVLFWQLAGIEHEGQLIKLGHHGIHVHAGHELEPAVSIERNGEPVADAVVFTQLIEADGKNTLAAEVGTVYEPPTANEPAHYAQGKLMVPKDAKKVIIRYRIILPGVASEFTQDVPVVAEKH